MRPRVSVDFPQPVLPTTPIFYTFFIEKETSFRMYGRFSLYFKLIFFTSQTPECNQFQRLVQETGTPFKVPWYRPMICRHKHPKITIGNLTARVKNPKTFLIFS